MLTLVKQYRKELRNILLFAVIVALLPYAPQAFHFLETFTGTMLLLAAVCGTVLGLSLKLHYRITVLRIAKEENL